VAPSSGAKPAESAQSPPKKRATIFTWIPSYSDIAMKNSHLDEKIFFKRCLHVVVLYITISPSHRNTFDDGRTTGNFDKETIMNTSISTKLTALALALVFNTAIMGGMAYLFNAQLQQPTAVASLASTAANLSNDVA
jgi:hypothetical protein